MNAPVSWPVPLPGSEPTRVVTLSVLCTVYFVPLAFPCERTTAESATLLLLGIAGLLAALGFVQGVVVQACGLDKVISFYRVYIPRLTTALAALIFLAVMSYWLIATGGVLRSPFAPLLTFAPVYSLVQVASEDDRKRFEALAAAWRRSAPHGLTTQADSFQKVLPVIRALELAALLVAVIAITLGEFSLRRVTGGGNPSEEILNCTTFVTLGYVSFYTTVMLAGLNALPLIWRRAISEWLRGYRD